VLEQSSVERKARCQKNLLNEALLLGSQLVLNLLILVEIDGLKKKRKGFIRNGFFGPTEDHGHLVSAAKAESIQTKEKGFFGLGLLSWIAERTILPKSTRNNF
jgi:hypothetical protein